MFTVFNKILLLHEISASGWFDPQCDGCFSFIKYEKVTDL